MIMMMSPLIAQVAHSSISALRFLCLLGLLAIPQCHAQTLKSLISLAQDLDAKIRTSTIGHVNAIETSDNKKISLCYLPYLDSFSEGDDNEPYNAVGSYEGVAALLLALEHLNTGNGTIVPELNGINERCPLKFYTNSFDTKGNPKAGVSHIMNLTDREQDQQLIPYAFLGAARSTVSIPTSIISSLRGFPQISPHSTAPTLDDTMQHDLFGRTIPNDDGTAVALLTQLAYWNIEHIAVLHINDAYGNAFANGIRDSAKNMWESGTTNVIVESVNLHPDADDAAIFNAIQRLNGTQYTYFFGIVYPTTMLDKVMEEAYDQGIAGTGLHTWLFSDSVGTSVTHHNGAVRTYDIRNTTEKKLLKAYRGSGLLAATGGISELPEMESFNSLALAMRQMRTDKQDMSFLDAHLPQYYSGKSVQHSEITQKSSFLSQPGTIAPFLYDAAVGLGLAACELMSTSEPNKYFTGEELFKAFVNTSFHGTSGLVDIDPETGTRKPQSAVFSLTNFVDDEDASPSLEFPQKVRFRGEQTYYLHSGKWAAIKNYTYNDGTHNRPPDLQAADVNRHIISTRIKVVGLVLCGIIIGLASIFAGWTYYNRHLQVVRSSQPIFLYIISSGTLLMGTSIIPRTFEFSDVHHIGSDMACMAPPWLLAVGWSLTFSAL